jgi:hypothetical protein
VLAVRRVRKQEGADTTPEDVVAEKLHLDHEPG